MSMRIVNFRGGNNYAPIVMWTKSESQAGLVIHTKTAKLEKMQFSNI